MSERFCVEEFENMCVLPHFTLCGVVIITEKNILDCILNMKIIRLMQTIFM